VRDDLAAVLVEQRGLRSEQHPGIAARGGGKTDVVLRADGVRDEERGFVAVHVQIGRNGRRRDAIEHGRVRSGAQGGDNGENEEPDLHGR
jgi:hypothetical protein